MLVIKRNGSKERIDFSKIKRVINRASIGLNNISIKKIEYYCCIQLYNGIKTTDIHEILIKVTADLISYKHPDYQYLAARLVVFNLRKKAYGTFNPPKLYDHVINLINIGKYDKKIIDYYDSNEFECMNNFIDHYRDMNFSYVAIKQLENKYLVQNRVTGKIYESAQFLYILVAACLFSNYNKKNRLNYIKKFYDAISTFKISLPTPIMSGVRTPTKQFSSCVLIECNDSIDSINATSGIIMKYISQRAGIGINAGRIRALGSPIRGGEAFHTGCIPFYKH
ncbi:MAG: ATP cone domain-containing protein, partial [Candidatus Lightella neohaematopini]|nr:ATP cone domain-containing protein [Candidatus Lightella neohaematopini]